MILPVIMAGGSGSRLWPLSRSLYPKQFLPLSGESGSLTMLQATVERLSGLNVPRAITICNEEHRFIVAEQFRAMGKRSTIILEPEGRNTILVYTYDAAYEEDEGDLCGNHHLQKS